MLQRIILILFLATPIVSAFSQAEKDVWDVFASGAKGRNTAVFISVGQPHKRYQAHSQPVKKKQNPVLLNQIKD